MKKRVSVPVLLAAALLGVGLTALLLGLTGLTTACDGPPPKSGYVEALHFYDRWTETIYTQICVVYGKYGCMSYMPIATGHVEHPPRWCLLIIDDKDKRHEGDVCMDPSMYAKYQIGMHYPDQR